LLPQTNVSGSGRVVVGDETVEIHTGDAVPVRLKDVHPFLSTGSADLEMMIFGISTQKNVLDTQLDSPEPTWLHVGPKK
jgi:mannose-6-phosphate isomerase-like protein (cupin superfamily)